jgi:hypothetical protein
MSVKVDIDQLGAALADYDVSYLITVGDDYRAKTVAVSPVLHDGVFQVGAVGGGTQRNLAAHDAVTLLWPPPAPGGYTLIVDGHGSLAEDTLTVVPATAVLHRPATPNSPPSATGCGDDCVPLA